MSYSFEQLADIEAAQADCHQFLSIGDFHNARAVIDDLGDRGYETEAMFLHRAYLRALTGGPSEDGQVKETMLRANDID